MWAKSFSFHTLQEYIVILSIDVYSLNENILSGSNGLYARTRNMDKVLLSGPYFTKAKIK